MIIRYTKLWQLLDEKKMKKVELMSLCGISSRTMAKLSKDENVNTDTLLQICSVLDCDISDIMEVCRDVNQLSFYECFRRTACRTEDGEFCVTFRFDYRNRKVILKKTKRKADRHTVIMCKNRDIIWEQLYPCGISPASEVTNIGNDSFAEKDALNLYVISGKPGIIRNLDTGRYFSAANTAADGIYVMSEARLKLFEPH